MLHEYQTKEYVKQANISDYKNSFFYTWSCSSGIDLGVKLYELGDIIFFGYTDIVIGISEGSYMDMFINCANEGMRLFLNGASIEDSYYGMLDLYKQKTIELSKNRYDAFAASALSHNRRALIYYGDKDATVADFTH